VRRSQRKQGQQRTLPPRRHSNNRTVDARLDRTENRNHHGHGPGATLRPPDAHEFVARLEHAATERQEEDQDAVTDYMSLPSDLPAPEDDGAADHLAGLAMPPITLAGTAGSRVALDDLGRGRTVLYIYPLSGRPGVDLPDGWDAIPGARGCTPEACGFRDHHAELRAAGAAAVFGLSSQSTDYQSELAERLGLPFEILSDPDLAVADALRLPTFTVEDGRLYKRLTLVVTDGRIEHAFYPIFPPDQHAAEVLQWLRDHGGGRA
jgi:peroxiredoxin